MRRREENAKPHVLHGIPHLLNIWRLPQHVFNILISIQTDGNQEGQVNLIEKWLQQEFGTNLLNV